MNRTTISEQLGVNISAAEISAQLERILASPWFMHSKRQTRFLRFIVEEAITGKIQDLKERSIGTEVFDRDPDYDVANDAIVRVGAGEIRKRLAQYYLHEGRSDKIVFDIPRGAYVPSFNWSGDAATRLNIAIEGDVDSATSPAAGLSSTTAPQSKPQALLRKISRSLRWRHLIYLGIAMALTVIVAVFVFLHRPAHTLKGLWRPILTHDQRVLVCVGNLKSSTPPDTGSNIRNSVNGLTTSGYIDPSNLSAIAEISDVLAREGKSLKLITADNTALTVLRSQPAIFTGAFDNRWTQRILSDSRFRFLHDPATGQDRIVDSNNPKQLDWTFNPNSPVNEIHRDFALVARVECPLTGQPELIMAGLGPYGTTAASEFVTNPEYFRQFTSKAPRGWAQKNIEIVLSTTVVDGHSSSPHMIAFDVW